ncbi:loganic acid O-methyltransferase-like isoform X2 [Mercurialis annua]|uniref:loganic acid O-methyltransferase-like isoform X2 n=1 Tax=Mercurialis annua TaxID=3986 RepID=UPI0021604B0A|nr:loganic acid O-methyltransferase-like isoform X2 [Mercurialis annua]
MCKKHLPWWVEMGLRAMLKILVISLQKAVLDAAKEWMNEAINDKLDFANLDFDTSKPAFKIVDLGCSTGPNTFFAVKNIIETVAKKYETHFQNPQLIEFQVFFNDFNGNDFNILFKTLPSYQNYFSAGVPGSFYARLFPKSTIHLAHSSNSLHWLSKIPPEIVDCESPAWNKGSIYCTGFSKEVANAYLGQYKRDMNSFLNARAEEIVGGGLMVILVRGLPDGILMSQTGSGVVHDLLGGCLTEMADLGEIIEEKVDSFNLPLYLATSKEIKEIIEENEHFRIENMKELTHPIMTMMKNTRPNPELAVLSLRAVLEGTLKNHFKDEEIVNKIFQRFTSYLQENYSNIHIIGHCIEHFILLKRKI